MSRAINLKSWWGWELFKLLSYLSQSMKISADLDSVTRQQATLADLSHFDIF